MKKLKIVDIFQYLFFLGLFVVSIIFMNEVILQYASGSTSLKQSEIQITESPTFTICFINENYSYEYGTNFTFEYDETKLNLITQSEYDTFHTSIDSGDHIANIELQKVYSYFSSPCYRFKKSSKVISNTIEIKIEFDKHFLDFQLPNIEVYVTSESNSNGVIFKEWMDGNELKFEFKRVRNNSNTNIFLIFDQPVLI